MYYIPATIKKIKTYIHTSALNIDVIIGVNWKDKYIIIIFHRSGTICAVWYVCNNIIPPFAEEYTQYV